MSSPTRLASGVPLVGQVSQYIISAGGKRLRPALLLLMCGALGYQGSAALQPGRRRGVHPHRHAAARRRGRRLHAAPRPRHRQRVLRQPGQRAGRRLSLLARLPDDGGRGQHAHHADPGRRDQRDRRRRSAAADEHARRLARRSRLPARDPLQDSQAVRSQHPARRRARRQHARTSKKPAPPMARRSARLSRSSTMCWTTTAMRAKWARTWATTCAKARPRCR